MNHVSASIITCRLNITKSYTTDSLLLAVYRYLIIIISINNKRLPGVSFAAVLLLSVLLVLEEEFRSFPDLLMICLVATMTRSKNGPLQSNVINKNHHKELHLTRQTK